jgi:hypothetical protein
MLFKKKWLNLKKKVILALFLKNQFIVDFRKIENFFGSRYPKIFYSPFSYQSGPKLLIYAKKITKNHFRRIAWTLSYLKARTLPRFKYFRFTVLTQISIKREAYRINTRTFFRDFNIKNLILVEFIRKARTVPRWVLTWKIIKNRYLCGTVRAYSII